MLVDTPHAIIGTAGHIDHGKTALVKALTGLDVDTLAEEKRRGITIELGFAFMEATGLDREIIFIDVPGHEKLIKTMVAGASNLDAALLVVAADEGVSVQTIEHFEVLQLFGIPFGVIALTKADLVDEHRIAEVTDEVHTLADGTFLEGAPVVPVSSITGQGIDQLKAALTELARNVRGRNDSGVFRMPIDRVFTMQGFGTVIAGTILSGTARIGDKLEILPEGLITRIRGIQVHAKNVNTSIIGTRTAINLQDVRKEDLRRGQCACAPGSVTSTSRMDVRLQVLSGFGEELKNRTRVRLHIGADEVMCRVALLDSEVVTPGGSALAQLVLESPTVAVSKDRFVIRSFSSMKTIGGGVVLDANPARHKRFDGQALEALENLQKDTGAAVEHALEKSGASPAMVSALANAVGEAEDAVSSALEALTEQRRAIRISPDAYLHARVFDDLSGKLIDILNDYYSKNPYRSFMPAADLQSRFSRLAPKTVYEAVTADLRTSKKLLVGPTKIGIAGHNVQWKQGERHLAANIEQVYRAAGYSTPPEEDVARDLGAKPDVMQNIMVALIDLNILVRLAERVTYHADWLKSAREIVIRHIERNGSITAAELRDQMGVTRKYTVALLEYLDTNQYTKRLGDKRVLGQRCQRKN